MKKENSRNGWVDLGRFVAAWIIVWFHFGTVPILSLNGTWLKAFGGGLFVEYFFLLSGYFSVMHVEKHSSSIKFPEKYIGQYTIKKWFHFLPYSVFAVFFAYIFSFIQNGYTWKEIIRSSFMAPFEMLLLRNTGINFSGQYGVLWYLSAMLITLPILLYIVLKYKDRYKYYFAWIMPLIIYGIIIRKIGTIRTTDYILSTLRAFAGLSLGGGLFYLADKLKMEHFNKRGKLILTSIEVGLFFASIIFVFQKSLSKTYNDVFFVLIIFISLLITFSEQSYTKYIQGSFFSRLGKLSLPIYCVHFLIIDFSALVNKNWTQILNLLSV